MSVDLQVADAINENRQRITGQGPSGGQSSLLIGTDSAEVQGTLFVRADLTANQQINGGGLNATTINADSLTVTRRLTLRTSNSVAGLTIAGLDTPPPGVAVVDVVVAPNGRLYRAS